MSEVSELAVCAICGWEGDTLHEHVVTHGYDLRAYVVEFPDAAWLSKPLQEEFSRRFKERGGVRRAPCSVTEEVIWGGVRFPLYGDVPSKDCLPWPAHYRLPTRGKLAVDVCDALVALSAGRSVFIAGPPGTGKDALVSALCGQTRRPSLTFTLAPHVDVQAWLYTRAFVKGGTTWDEGVLLRAVRDGYTTRTGRRVPYLILLSDFDRATRGQAEILRLIMDSTQGRVLGPRGETYVVFPGTQIVATANSTGGGDSTGRCISANPIDASLMDRFERKFLFHPLDREDEKEILSARYPNLANAIPGALDQILSATEKIREAVAAEQIYFEWSHRAVCAWVEAAEDLLFAFGPTATAPNLLQRAVRAVLDGSPNQETRDALKTLIDPHIRGGVIVTGSLDHHRKGPLV